MNRVQIEKHFGPTWVDFMVPFAESDKMATILTFLKDEKAAGKSVLPDPGNVFRCFRETPLNTVRVVILGQDPYPKKVYANGIAFSVEDTSQKTPPSLEKIVDAVEVDCYSGLSFDKPGFDRSLLSWTKQGVLLLNTALTVVEGEPSSHSLIWQPFIEFVISQLQIVKKDVIYGGWGKSAQDALKNINIFTNYMLPAIDHPSNAARKQEAWKCNHFSMINAMITANGLGEKIAW